MKICFLHIRSQQIDYFAETKFHINVNLTAAHLSSSANNPNENINEISSLEFFFVDLCLPLHCLI